MAEQQKPRTIMLGRRPMTFPSDELGTLEDSSHLLGDVTALRETFEDQGYLFIRGLHNREEVLAARGAVLEHIDQSESLDKTHPLGEGVLKNGCGVGCVPFMEGRNDITHCEAVIKVLEGPRPRSFFKSFFGSEVKTFDYKWLRAMHQEGFTGIHVDNVYMSRGSPRLMTMWTPIGDVTVEMGVLALCEGSHRLDGFNKFQDTYGNMDAEKVNLKGTGWFTEDPEEIKEKFGGQWKTADVRAGDVIVFGMRTAHMSTTNTTRLARISCDTRWQPATDPLDPRYSGPVVGSDLKFGLLSTDDLQDDIIGQTKVTQGHQDKVTIEQLKVTWGL